jgi:NitT/TauT family transport system substrate-binding protein
VIGLIIKAALAQELRDIRFVYPSPSAFKPFTVFMAICEVSLIENGLNVTVETINGSRAVLRALAAEYRLDAPFA